MKIKLFEIRDAATFIPAIAIQLGPDSEEERYLLGRSGYGLTPGAQSQFILFGKLEGGQLTYDPHSWPQGTRTMPCAHQYIIDQWRMLQSGDVIDVEHIMGLSISPKLSERLEEHL